MADSQSQPVKTPGIPSLTPIQTEVMNAWLATANPISSGNDIPSYGDIETNGGCKYTRKGAVYIRQSCDCKPGFHEPDLPLVDESAPPDIRVACEPNAPESDDVVEMATMELSPVGKAKLAWLKAQEQDDPDRPGEKLFGPGWMARLNGTCDFRRDGSAYLLVLNNCADDCEPPILPFVEGEVPETIRVVCRRPAKPRGPH